MFTFTENRSLKIELKNGFTVFIEAEIDSNEYYKKDAFDKIKALFANSIPFTCEKVYVFAQGKNGEVLPKREAAKTPYFTAYKAMSAEELVAFLMEVSNRPPVNNAATAAMEGME